MGAIGKPVPQPELSERVWPGTVALSDRKRAAPRIVRPGDGRRTHCASTAPSSVGKYGRVSARCDSQPEDLLRRDDVDARGNSALARVAGVHTGRLRLLK